MMIPKAFVEAIVQGLLSRIAFQEACQGSLLAGAGRLLPVLCARCVSRTGERILESMYRPSTFPKHRERRRPSRAPLPPRMVQMMRHIRHA
jgi:hypothetical protein